MGGNARAHDPEQSGEVTEHIAAQFGPAVIAKYIAHVSPACAERAVVSTDGNCDLLRETRVVLGPRSTRAGKFVGENLGSGVAVVFVTDGEVETVPLQQTPEFSLAFVAELKTRREFPDVVGASPEREPVPHTIEIGQPKVSGDTIPNWFASDITPQRERNLPNVD